MERGKLFLVAKAAKMGAKEGDIPKGTKGLWQWAPCP